MLSLKHFHNSNIHKEDNTEARDQREHRGTEAAERTKEVIIQGLSQE